MSTTVFHAWINAWGGKATYDDVWNIPKYLPCDVCGVPFGDHGSAGSFGPPTLDEVLCDDPQCPANLAEHTLADHA